MKILIVEDERRIATYLKEGLEMQQYVVDLAHDGQDGLDLALANQYDGIVLDRLLPSLDGLEFCKQFRQANGTTPILMLTALDQISDKVIGLDSGADDYLAKPFAFEELLARLRALTRRPSKVNDQTLRFADLTLNTNLATVSRSRKKVILTKKEFALLEFLLRHQDRVFSKEELLDKVWPFEADIFPNTVQVYIGYLRNKIDRAFPTKPNLIQTVRGFGYKIALPQTIDSQQNSEI